MNVSKTRAVGYVRTSTGRQKLSADIQRAALTAWADRSGVELVAVFCDLGLSGALPIHRRPSLLAAFDALGAHGAEVLVVSSRDRLARNVLVAAMAERIVKQHGARIVSADAESDPVVSLMAGMADVFAEYERAMSARRTVAAMALLAARGAKVGGVQSYGVCDGISAARNDAEREIVAAVLEGRSAGLSLRGIVANLAERGMLTRRGGAIASTQVVRILKRAA